MLKNAQPGISLGKQIILTSEENKEKLLTNIISYLFRIFFSFWVFISLPICVMKPLTSLQQQLMKIGLNISFKKN